MNYQLRGFRISFVVHAALLLAVIALDSSMARFSRPVLIDFSIMENATARAEPKTVSAPRSREAKVRQQQPEPKPVAARQEPLPQRTVEQQTAALSETAAGSQAPVPAAGPSAGLQQATAVSSSAPAGDLKAGGKASASEGQANPAEGMKQSYLKEHFAYIRNIVQKKLSYPGIARKMGWEGKVVISFIVCLDGQVRDIVVREGSGIELLDKNAIAAVRNASPFPKPPVEAQLIMPVSYSLD